MLVDTIRRAATAVATMLVALAGAPGSAAADARSDMYAQLGVDKVGADYVFLVDESGSMSAIFPALRRALAQFTGSIEAGDRIAFVPFDEEPSPGPWLAGKSKEASAAAAALPNPASSTTNFYDALTSAVNLLIRDGASDRVATVVLLSDGDPDQKGLRTCVLPPAASWQPVRASAAGLARTRPVNAYAVQITGTHKECATTTQAILRNVFPSPETLTPSGQTGAYLTQAKDAARAAKARLVLRNTGELTKTVTLEWNSAVRDVDPTADTMKLPVTLTVNGKGPVVVSDITGQLTITVRGAGPEHSVRTPITGTPGSLTVTPGRPAKLTVTAGLQPPTGFQFWHQDVTGTGTLTVAAKITAPWLDLAGGGLSNQLKASLAQASTPVAGDGSRGTPNQVWFVLGLIAVIAVFAVAAWYYGGRPMMRGTLLVTPPGEGTTPVPLTNNRKVKQAVGNGRLVVAGARVRGAKAMSVTWTDPRRSGTKDLVPGGSVMISGTSFEHREPAA